MIALLKVVLGFRFFSFVLGALTVATVFGNSVSFAVEPKVDPQSRYSWAVNKIRTSTLLEQKSVSPRVFARFDWVGKTALINTVCNDQRKGLCYSALKQGLIDEALVVRDHALRVILQNGEISKKAKQKVAQKIVNDDRNYRRGKALWIVQNAQDFLSDPK